MPASPFRDDVRGDFSIKYNVSAKSSNFEPKWLRSKFLKSISRRHDPSVCVDIVNTQSYTHLRYPVERIVPKDLIFQELFTLKACLTISWQQPRQILNKIQRIREIDLFWAKIIAFKTLEIDLPPTWSIRLRWYCKHQILHAFAISCRKNRSKRPHIPRIIHAQSLPHHFENTDAVISQ